ncbi:unnamed protein product, partial [Scytosiphon promiscuus]
MRARAAARRKRTTKSSPTRTTTTQTRPHLPPGRKTRRLDCQWQGPRVPREGRKETVSPPREEMDRRARSAKPRRQRAPPEKTRREASKRRELSRSRARMTWTVKKETAAKMTPIAATTEEETEEDREARLAEYAAAKAEEDAIKQERRAIRENPAVIPKLGAFFVHDDRSGGAGGKSGAGSGRGDGAEGAPEEEEEAEEEATLGRWRADALATNKKKTGGGHGSWGRKKPVDPDNDDDLPWGHEGFEEVLRAEEEGRPIASSSDFWSNPTGKSSRSDRCHECPRSHRSRYYSRHAGRVSATCF